MIIRTGNVNGNFGNQALANNFYAFFMQAFKTINPGTELLSNWHIHLIGEHLQACERGEIKRLIINIPPRYLKSIIVNVVWPAWLLLHNPAERIISASYSQSLATKHSLDTRLIMNSDWYKSLSTQTRIQHAENEKDKFVTTQRGFRLATSVGGTLTGEGGNYLILDDPHNPAHMHSDLQRTNTIEWYEQVFASRHDDKRKGVTVLIMQRLHVDDLTGHLLTKNPNGWEHLQIPAIAEKTCNYYYKSEKGIFTHQMNEGDAIHPEREDAAMLKNIEAELGTFNFAAQYLQNPLPTANGLIKREWLKYYHIKPVQLNHITQSWDTAVKTGATNDYSVCTTWGETENGFYLLDVFREKLEYPSLKHAVINQAEKWQPENILVEDKSAGQSILQDLRAETKLPLIAINPKHDKFIRFAAVTSLLESGRVIFPAKATWLSDFELELFSFPYHAHDDSVDSFSQYLNWVRHKKVIVPNIRRL